MRFLAQTALAVLVLTGWFIALLWLTLSVSQIAVDRVTTSTCVTGPVAVASPGEVACR